MIKKLNNNELNNILGGIYAVQVGDCEFDLYLTEDELDAFCNFIREDGIVKIYKTGNMRKDESDVYYILPTQTGIFAAIFKQFCEKNWTNKKQKNIQFIFMNEKPKNIIIKKSDEVFIS